MFHDANSMIKSRHHVCPISAIRKTVGSIRYLVRGNHGNLSVCQRSREKEEKRREPRLFGRINKLTRMPTGAAANCTIFHRSTRFALIVVRGRGTEEIIDPIRDDREYVRIVT